MLNKSKLKSYGDFLLKNPFLSFNYLTRPKFILNRLFNLLDVNYRCAELDTIILYVNSICNMKCLMCDIGQKNKKGIDLLIENQTKTFLGPELLKKLLNDPYIKRRKIYFHLLMTEPLLHPHIEKVIKLIKSKRHFVSLTTNGFLLKKKATNLINSGVDMIKVSLDGPEKVHDSLRGVKGVYQNAIEGIKILNKNKKLKIRINFTVMPSNVSEMSNFLEDIDRENIRVDVMKFQFLDFISNEMKEKHNAHCDIKQTESCLSETLSPTKVDVKELVKQISLIKKNKYKNIKEIWIIPSNTREVDLNRYFDLEGKKIKNNSKCFFPWTQLAFTTDGKILIHMRCFNFIYGNFTKQTIGQIFHNQRINFFRNKLKKANFCFPACTRCCGVTRTKIINKTNH